MTVVVQNQKFRINASALRGYFKSKCDRLFRWETVESRDRGRQGIGWGVRNPPRSHSRPGIKLLMEAGDVFERSNIERLENELVDAPPNPRLGGMLTAGVITERGRQVVQTLTFVGFLAALRQPVPPRYIAQIQIDLSAHPQLEADFLQLYGLSSDQVRLSETRPDMIEVIDQGEDFPFLLRVWDFKASMRARHEHFIQVAYYSHLLEQMLVNENLDRFQVDTEKGVIFSREGQEIFDLEPYRVAVGDFLRNKAHGLFAIPAANAHFLVCENCVLCEYLDTCKTEADAGFDLSRIAYISSESKRSLVQNGIRNHRDLAQVSSPVLIEHLRNANHDLSVNLMRYIETARALEDGAPRSLNHQTLQMPQYENIRVILSAEKDPVTNTCFALGIKTYEGWDQASNRPLGQEHAFIADQEGDEVGVLLPFLQTLNIFLRDVDRQNREAAARPIDNIPEVVAARQALDAFRVDYPTIPRSLPNARQLDQQRNTLKAAVKFAEMRARNQGQRSLHIYIYDTLDLHILREMIERHLFDTEPAELLPEIRTLIRIFPPESVLPDAATFRTIPGTVVIQVLRSMVALPAPYQYDLRTVSQLYPRRNREGQDAGFSFVPRFGFGWEYSNQVAFERIHDIWQNQNFEFETRGRSGMMTPIEVHAEIERTILNKLRATDSIIQRLKQQFTDQLRLRKEPFRLHEAFDPIDFQMLEALNIFSLMETSLDELQIKHLHTLPIEDRNAKFEAARSLRFVEREPNSQWLWFSMDPGSRDTKIEAGDFNLVLTPENAPEILLGQVDATLFDTPIWRTAPYDVVARQFDLTIDPPRILLEPRNPDKFMERFDPDGLYVLDRKFLDLNSSKIFATLEHLRRNPEQARHIHELLATISIIGWQPFIQNSQPIAERLRQLHIASGGNPDRLLNTMQWQAWHGVFREPLSMIWGPPGTGKTHTLGQILIGYSLFARANHQQLRILVCAFTHHAINNVLSKVTELAEHYGISTDDLAMLKLQSSHVHTADRDLPARIQQFQDNGAGAQIQSSQAPCLIVGSTVWGIYKAMESSGSLTQSWFDVILIDEASQMKLPDSLIAFSASQPSVNIILAGDDQQLPPIIHGTYPEKHAYMLTSVFAFMRHRAEEHHLEERVLFQLEDNFRMNEPLTAYPRDILYRGRFSSTNPLIRIQTTQPLDPSTNDLIDFLLSPDRPAILCSYTPPQSFTVRNSIEARIISRIASRLSEILIDQHLHQRYSPAEFANRGLAVLSPHRAQNSTIRQILRDQGFGTDQRPIPLVDTVDKLQGQERDVVIVSYGVADVEYAEAEAEFLLSYNRFNVAQTRAKHKAIVFCSNTVLDLVPTDQQTLLDSMMLKGFRGYCSDGEREFTENFPEFGEVTIKVQWKGFLHEN